MRGKAIAVGVIGTLVGVLFSRLFKRDPDAAPSTPSEPLDDYAPRETTQAGACSLTPKPGVKAVRAYIIEKYGEHTGAPENILRDCSQGSPSEHWEGRAWDWMITDKPTAERILSDLMANDNELIRRMGIMYLIFDHRIWRAYEHGSETRVWAPYTGPNPHTDHIHMSFSWAGARGETSWFRQQKIA